MRADPIPRSGPEGRKVNAFSVKIALRSTSQSELELLVDAVDSNAVVGRVWSEADHKYEATCCVPVRNLDDFSMQLYRYYGLHDFLYDSSITMLALEAIAFPFWFAVSDRIAQTLFNARTPVRTSRIDWLKLLLRLRREAAIAAGGHLNDERGRRSAVGLLSERYGDRISFAQTISHILPMHSLR